MGCLGRSAVLGFAYVALGLLSAPPAAGGAWTRAPGEGLLIATTGRRVAPVGSLAGGPVDSDRNISQIYLEYGLIEGLTVGGKLYVELSASDLRASSASLGGFLRKRVWRDGHGGVASLEAGYAHPIEDWIGNGLEYADPGAVPQAHFAGLYGHGWGGGWGNAFVSTGAAYYWRGEGLADELRAEITGGYSPWRHWSGMLSLYGLYPLAGGTDPSFKLAPSIAYSFRLSKDDAKADARARPRTIQIGLSYDLLKPGDGLGFSLSLWQPF